MSSSNSGLSHWVLCGSLSDVGCEKMKGFSPSVKGGGNVMENWKNYQIVEGRNEVPWLWDNVLYGPIMTVIIWEPWKSISLILTIICHLGLWWEFKMWFTGCLKSSWNVSVISTNIILFKDDLDFWSFGVDNNEHVYQLKHAVELHCFNVDDSRSFKIQRKKSEIRLANTNLSKCNFYTKQSLTFSYNKSSIPLLRGQSDLASLAVAHTGPDFLPG